MPKKIFCALLDHWNYFLSKKTETRNGITISEKIQIFRSIPKSKVETDGVNLVEKFQYQNRP